MRFLSTVTLLTARTTCCTHSCVHRWLQSKVVLFKNHLQCFRNDLHENYCANWHSFSWKPFCRLKQTSQESHQLIFRAKHKMYIHKLYATIRHFKNQNTNRLTTSTNLTWTRQLSDTPTNYTPFQGVAPTDAEGILRRRLRKK